MTTSIRLASALVLATLALSACGKPKPAVSAAPHLASAASDTPSAPRPSAAPAAPVAPEADAASLSPAELADRLLAGPFSLAGLDFSDDTPLACDSKPGASDAWTVHCQARARDGERGGRPAMVEIQLYDHDVDLAMVSQPLQDHIASLNQEWALNNTPDITVTNKASGATTKMPVTCRQALGRHNSPAYCELMETPRIVVVTGVMPLHPSTRSLSMSADDTKADSSQDADHAADLGLIVIGQIGSKL